jgi:hypothetical protein
VTHVGLVTSLFAGTTSLDSFKYSSALSVTVKKLKRGSQSAGNRSYAGSSETTRDGIVENLKPISDYVPTHKRPEDDSGFGHYLAGLIDGDGHFSLQQQLVISFHALDAPLAYYVKRRLNYGSVRAVKGKRAYTLVVSSRRGLDVVLALINGKLRTKRRYDQVVNNILAPRLPTEAPAMPFLASTSSCLENR